MHYLGLLEFSVRICDSHTQNLPNLSYVIEISEYNLVVWLLLVFFWLVGLSVEAKDDWTFSHCFHRISFCSRVYMYMNHGMYYLYHEVHEIDGYNYEFWKTLGYSLKCVLELVASTSHTKVHSKASHSTLLSWMSLKTYILYHIYRAANRIKPLLARSTNGLPLDQKFHLIPQAHLNFEILFYSLWSSWLFFTRWHLWHIGTLTNQHKTGSQPPK